MVMVWAPSAAALPTLTVTVDFPEPGFFKGSGSKLTVTPLGRLFAVKLMLESKWPRVVVQSVEVPLPPRGTSIKVGERLKAKLGVSPTARVTVVFIFLPPPVPITVRG